MKAFGPSIALLLFALPSFAETYQVSSSNDSGPGTLRQAILDANGNPGTDSIVFTTSGVSGFGAMPQITGVVNIDGTVGNTTARINGLVFDGDTAFDFAAGSSGSTIRDVQVEDYPNAVRILTTNITVQNVQAPLTGLSLQGSNNLIGGTTAGTGNRFLLLSGAGDDNLILNNRISNINIIAAANNRFGNATIGNALGLVQINNCPGTIFENNVIGGGITINDSGTPSTGTRIIGNTMTNDGVAIGTATPGIEIARNSINNVGIPIDLGNNGPTANDAPPDADTGAKQSAELSDAHLRRLLRRRAARERDAHERAVHVVSHRSLLGRCGRSGSAHVSRQLSGCNRGNRDGELQRRDQHDAAGGGRSDHDDGNESQYERYVGSQRTGGDHVSRHVRFRTDDADRQRNRRHGHTHRATQRRH